MKPLIAGIIVLLLNLSCNNTTKPPVDASMPRVVKAHGYVIPKDKLLPPVVIPAKEPVIVPAGKPRLFVMPSNIHKAGIAKIHRTPGKVSTPGQNGLALPATVPVVGKTTVAGTPEVVVARDAFTKDQNAQNFNFFTKMQGLAGDEINCLTEDRNGNLWIGTKRGGASKYDGKNFTNYSARCGLSNYILSILEDSKGNMWFGTMMSGVFKYDGYQFTQFTTNEGLSDDDVLSLFEDKKGNIWLGTSNGVNKYDGKSLTIYGTREGIANSFIVKIMEDKNGNLWFCCQHTSPGY